MRAGALSLLLASALLLGCQSASPTLGEGHGIAYRKNVEGMTADPTAAQRNTAPVLGVGPATAADIAKNYHENQQTDTQKKAREAAGIVRVRGR